MKEFKLPILYGVSKKGKIKQWYISVIEDNNNALIKVRSGYVNSKIKETVKEITKGKNIGKKNETNPFEQAVSEAKSNWEKKRHKNYRPEMIDLNTYVPEIILPMLAKGPGKGKIKFPCRIQPKLNGICNLSENTNDKVLHHSRGGHLFTTVTHLDKWVKQLNAPGMLHGELYKHGWSLQKISSYTKELKPDYDTLEFWIYDLAQLNVSYDNRLAWINTYIRKLPSECKIKITPTFEVNNMEEAKVYHDRFVQDGFEGAMLKNKNGFYIFQYNSDDIEKMKDFDDAEFQIIGGKEGEGLDKGCIIYRCITKKGEEFDVRPRGTVEERKELFQRLKEDIGKPLTVRYPELTESGKPSQPVGIIPRDYE